MGLQAKLYACHADRNNIVACYPLLEEEAKFTFQNFWGLVLALNLGYDAYTAHVQPERCCCIVSTGSQC